MDCLVKQLNVLREIAFHRPNAHLAFLYHKPYRNMYKNKGQDAELCNKWGNWEIEYFYGLEQLIYFKLRHTNLKFHAQQPAIFKRMYPRYNLIAFFNKPFKNCLETTLYEKENISYYYFFGFNEPYDVVKHVAISHHERSALEKCTKEEFVKMNNIYNKYYDIVYDASEKKQKNEEEKGK